MKKLIVIIIVLVAVGVGAGAFYMRKGNPEPTVSTAQLSRGDIVDVVAATGTLEAVTTVQVGTQVSGTVQDLYADFNDIVKKGQIIARLDPSLLQTQIEQQKANVTRSEADLERLKVSLADAKQKLERARALSEKNLLPRTELETAEVNVRSAEAQIKSSEAGLVQARSQLNTAQVNLEHTIITAPIDGIVISRQVEPGQTVAASMNAPTLFILAADLSKMQINANIDEADVGRMRPGQVVNFRVDAFPTESFTGAVQQVRLQPTTVQNVVTYQTVISVPNPQWKLKPGMTANVNIEIARKNNVLRVPNAALRFRPTTDMFAQLNLPVPPELQRGPGGFNRGGGGRNGMGGGQPGGQPGQTGQPAGGAQATPGSTPSTAPQGAASAPSAGNRQPAQPPAQGTNPQAQGNRQREGSAAENRGGGDRGGFGGGGRGGFDPNMTPEERQKRMQERLAAMTPEERARFEERMKERAAQGGGNFGNRGGDQGTRGGNATANNAPGGARTGQGRVASAPSMTAGATTIDALFGPLPTVESRGRVWLWVNKQLKSVPLRLGISDGTYTEVIDAGGLDTGSEVVINLLTGLEPKTSTPGQTGGSQNPLMGPQRGQPGRGGPTGGRGR